MPPRVRALAEEIAAKHAVSVEDLISASHKRKVSYARWEVWARLRSEPGPSGEIPSLPKIGAWFSKDHSTVVQGLRRHSEMSA